MGRFYSVGGARADPDAQMTNPLGLIAFDITGRLAGHVEATYPYDGSDPEFAVIRLARAPIGRTRLVPVEGALPFGHDCLQFPCSLTEMEDAPCPDDYRWEFEQADYARAYW